ncbi:hypothetical protein BGZ60DRAFT_395288 [Tricladium varicosporioides]|nr:hypothetical protein BGZ60DRAFT_395288 [Hymenoscyphus varicosporioides]
MSLGESLPLKETRQLRPVHALIIYPLCAKFVRLSPRRCRKMEELSYPALLFEFVRQATLLPSSFKLM